MTALNTFLCKVVVAIVNPIILLLAAAAFIYFLWGVTQVIIQKGQGEDATDAKSSMLWGIVGLAIIFGAYGIINIAIGSANGIFDAGIPVFTGTHCAAPTTTVPTGTL